MPAELLAISQMDLCVSMRKQLSKCTGITFYPLLVVGDVETTEKVLAMVYRTDNLLQRESKMK